MSKKDDSLVVVATCNDLFAANILAGKLEANGIKSLIKNCSVTACQTSPYDAVTGVFDIYVLSADEQEAKAILDTKENDN